MRTNDDERREVAARLRNDLVAMRIRKDRHCVDSDVVRVPVSRLQTRVVKSGSRLRRRKGLMKNEGHSQTW